MSINNGGPAFPYQEHHADGTHYHSWPGMSLRDHFAGQAMAQFTAAYLIPGGNEVHSLAKRHSLTASAICAKLAYEWADAMLKAREVQS